MISGRHGDQYKNNIACDDESSRQKLLEAAKNELKHDYKVEVPKTMNP